MNQKACHHLHMRKKPGDDDELGSLLSSSATKAKQPKTTMSWDLGSSSSFALEEKN
jgi:hypothetical protein